MADTDIRERNALFAAVFESAPDAMVLTGPDGRIRLVNAQVETLFGHRREELIGQTIEVLLPRRFHAAHIASRLTYSAPEAIGLRRNVELSGLRKDGAEFPVEISSSLLLTESGPLVTSAIRDITERKRPEAGTREASPLQGEFVANISHELRTPLNAIIGFAELMHSGKVGPMSEQHTEYLGDILVSSRQLLHLINDVLDVARIDSGRMPFTYEPVDLGEVVDDVLDALRELAENKDLTVERRVDPTLGEVVADASKVRQILYNYLSNAITFSPRGGRIHVRVEPEAVDCFRIDVEDTGAGIAPDLIPNLFEQFQPLDADTARRHQGTGLGLALTRRLAEGHGGRVSVRSAPGRGSTFSAVLPRQSHAPPSRSP